MIGAEAELEAAEQEIRRLESRIDDLERSLKDALAEQETAIALANKYGEALDEIRYAATESLKQ